jgi:hypothetical protein
VAAVELLGIVAMVGMTGIIKPVPITGKHYFSINGAMMLDPGKTRHYFTCRFQLASAAAMPIQTRFSYRQPRTKE